ncbi:hypothetical protein DVH07_05065 [Hafnia paralvei]|jgi:hypothetical protein|uniref:hypothetical protein n=1 Tax=Hafnia paralvei TaxID=546367 RepID=UPI000DF24F27|nr:hypothetical protein [Hafnia paralvei]RDA69979.1 hypothetical protein DU449_05065 [Hafnia paralvei]RDA70807.1 hypothetical protein DVH09_05450 [Hafnia paralvei]RDA73755.1 hypothetical protein DVH08_00570 [Hafnia paralvei]RDA80242.1 hypothetical protein DVH10_04915 [Hafnia paralvei]RDA80590.1 hypothetical protein DVH07_05065 [Hafnia paralvei]
MNITLDRKELKDIPLIEREVIVDNSKLLVRFSLIGDLDFEFEYFKVFQSNEDALCCAEKFITQEDKDSVAGCDNVNFQKQQIISKIKFLEYIIAKKITLPDDGDGFIYNGDLNYVNVVLERLKLRLR